ncbi:hypothetical protein A2U01_0096172, partial [Trifolium medium]|nr:hypothetical protein [Trifolium medium]
GSEAEGNAVGTEGNANIGQGIRTQSEVVHGIEAGIGTQSEIVHGTEAEGQGIGTAGTGTDASVSAASQSLFDEISDEV